MREIRFRGRGIVDEKWYYGSLIIDKENYEIFYYNNLGISGTVSVKPESVGQYTAKKDKNKVAIYEDDVYKWGNEFGKIIYKHGSFRCENLDNDFELCSMNNTLEILGNITDNPELLRK